MKVITNRSLAAFIAKLRNQSSSPNEVVFRVNTALTFMQWLSTSKYVSESDSIRFKNELYRIKHEYARPKAPLRLFPLKYVGFSLAVLSLLLIGGGIYYRFYKNVRSPFAFSSAPVRAGRIISFQGRLTDTLGNPISAPIDVSYHFYTASSGLMGPLDGSYIAASKRVCTASPDQDGIFNTTIGNDSGGSGATLCNVELPSSIFTENPNVYLGVTIGTELTEMSPRQQIANVGYAINSETLQGMPPGQTVSNIPFINQDGDMLIAASNPGIRSLASSNFTISSALATTITSAGAGDITLSATGGGALRFNTYNGTLEERFTILANGNVGIGTTAPSALLDIAGNATVSGSLVAGGQIKVGEFGSAPVTYGDGSMYYDTVTKKIYFWNGTAWTEMGSGGVQYLQRTLGSLAPTNITDDFNLGAVATGSATVHLPGLTNNNAFFNLGTGRVGIGTTNPGAKLHALSTSEQLRLGYDVSNYGSFSVDAVGNIILAATGTNPNITLTPGGTGYTILNGNVGIGTTTPGYKLDVSGGTGIVGQFSGRVIGGDAVNTNEFATLGQVSSSNYWQRTLGSLAPTNITDDVNIGAIATGSSLVHLPGLPNQNAWFNLGTGNVGIGTTGPQEKLEISSAVNDSYSYSSNLVFSYSGAPAVYKNSIRNFFSGNPGAENMAFYVSNGIEVNPLTLYVDNRAIFNGNVGIGTTAPSALLDVAGTASVSGFLTVGNGTTNTIRSTYGPLTFDAKTGADTWTTAMTIDDLTGNVGIGTTAPSALFSVGPASQFQVNALGNITTSGNTFDFTTASTTNYIQASGANSGLRFRTGGTTDKMAIGSVGGVSIGNSYVSTDPGAGNLIVSGNVGIGLTTPSTRLDVLQSATTSTAEEIAHFALSDDANAYVSLRNGSTTDSLFSPQLRFKGSGSTTAGNIQAMITTDTGTSPAWVFTGQQASSAIVTRPLLAIRNFTTDVMNILANGNVGIGVTAPNAKLDVAGNLNVSTYATVGASLAVGYTTAPAGPGNGIFSGNVGIGTTAPAYRFDVSGGTGIVGQFSGRVIGADAVNINEFTTLSQLTNSQYWQRTLGSLAPTNITDDVNIGAIATGSALVHFPGQTNADAWFNLGTGKVGIGTSTPSQKLEVVGNINIVAGNQLITDKIITGSTDLDIDSSLNTRDILFTTNSTEHMRIDTTNGNLGIGTTAPSEKIDIVTTSGQTAMRVFNGTSDNIFGVLSGGGAFIGNNYAQPLSLYTSGVERMTILSGGNVGIGITSPTAKLDIAGNLNVGTYATVGASLAVGYSSAPAGPGNGIFSGSLGIGTTAPSYLFDVSGGTGIVGQFSGRVIGADAINVNEFTTLGQISSGAGQYWQRALGSLAPTNITDDINIGAIATGSALVHFPGQNNANAWFNLGTGNVGIGLTNPIYKLDVVGDVNLTGAIRANGDPGITGYLLTSAAGGVNTWTNPTTLGGGTSLWQRTLGSLAPTNITDDVNIGAIATGSALVHLPGLNNQNAWFNLGTGNVGIGTTAPATDLDVKGSGTGHTMIGESVGDSAYSGISFNGSLSATNYNILGSPGDNSLYINRPTGGNIYFGENDSENQLFLQQGGAIGVGTSNPLALFDIAGNLQVQSYASVSASLAVGYTTAPAGPGNAIFSGNLGIGTTAPAYRFDVSGGAGIVGQFSGRVIGANAVNTNEFITLSQLNSGQYWQRTLGSLAPLNITDDINIGAVATSSAPLVHLPGTNNQNAWFKLGTGNVGIGTTGPTDKLTVQTAVANSNTGITLNNSSSVAMATLRENSSNGAYLSLNDSSATLQTLLRGGGGASYINGGNVGIGTTNPLNKLDVRGQTIVGLHGAPIAALAPSGLEVTLSSNSLITLGENVAGDANPALTLYRTSSGFRTGTAFRLYKPASNGGIYFQEGTNNAVYGSETYTTNMTILANGNVGIGTTSPAGKLHISNGVGGTGIYIDGFTAATNPTIQNNSNNEVTFRGSGGNLTGIAYNFVRYDTAASFLAITNQGNVGIGTTAPTAKLDVVGDASLSGHLAFTGATPNYIHVLNGTDFIISNSPGGVAGNVDRIALTGAGNVGIGTTVPTQKLAIGGNVAISQLSGIYVSDGTLANDRRIIGQDAGNILRVGANTVQVTALSLSVQNFVDALYLNNSGNIGIGTTAPTAKLDILGNLNVSGYATVGASLAIGYTGAPAGPGNGIFSGLVGIGTSAPSQKLHVVGASILANNTTIDPDSYTNSMIAGNIADGSGWGVTGIGGNAGTGDSWGIGHNGGSLYFGMQNGAAANTMQTYLRFDPNRNTYINETSGNLGLGTTAPAAKLAVNGGVHIGGDTDPGDNNLWVDNEIQAVTFADKGSPTYYISPANGAFLGGNIRIDSAVSANSKISFVDNALGTPTIASISAGTNGAGGYTIFLTAGNQIGNVPSTNVCIGDPTLVGGVPYCNGKLDAGTIDPPYTINGKRYATYVASMTGVKEETTGNIYLSSKSKTVNGYEYVIDFNAQTDGSDLWLFAKTTALRNRLDRMSVLMSPSDNARTWYKIDPTKNILTLYSSRPTTISYRLTAPRFDDEIWKNITPNGSGGHTINDPDVASLNTIQIDGNGNVAGQLVANVGSESGYALLDEMGVVIEETVMQAKTVSAHIVAGLIQAQKIVSPLAEIDILNVRNKITSPIVETDTLKASNTIEAPTLKTNEIQINTQGGKLAELVIKGLNNTSVARIDSEGNASFAGTLTAEAVESRKSKVESLEAGNASVAGTLIAKNIQSENIDEIQNKLNVIANEVKQSQLQIASSSSTPRNDMLAEQINSIQSELALLKNQPLPNPAYYQNIDASYANLTVTDTANMYKAHIADSLVVGTLFIQPNSILALSSDLRISSLGTIRLFDDAVVIAKNGDMTIKGEVAATSLAIRNTEGVVVASIDASGSARFNEVIAKKFTLETIATQGAVIADSGMRNDFNAVIPAIKTNAEVAGTGVVPQDTKEVIVYNDNVTTNSLIYLTPTSNNIQGQLSVSKKVSCSADLTDSTGSTCSPYFIVSSSADIHSASSFNWLIIN